MSNIITSQNMSLPIPVVAIDPGPDYALNVDACLAILDAHTHSPGSGVQITPSGLNINADLGFLNNNLTAVRSVRFQSQGSPIGGTSDLDCAYVSGADLYYNDGNGNQVRITNAGAVAGTPGSISGLVAPATAGYSAGSFTFFWRSNTNAAAAMNMGAISILKTNVANSAGVTLQASNSTSSSYTLTLPVALPASTQYFATTSAGVMSTVTGDSIVEAATTAGASILATNIVVALGTGLGQAIITNQITQSTTSTTPVTVTGLGGTLICGGGPVHIKLFGAQTNVSSLVVYAGTASGQIFCLRDGTIIGQQGFASNANTTIPPSSFSFIDTGASAGSHVYTIQFSVVTSGTILLQNVCSYIKEDH